MNNKFSTEQVSQLSEALGTKFNVRVNKAGNITVEYLPEFDRTIRVFDNQFWTLYRVQSGNYLWRRHIGYGYCYPLHMVNRPRIGPYYEYESCGKTYRTYARGFDIKNCEMNTFNEAVNYFINYLKKYRNIDVTA